jgi:ferredoxin
MAKRKIIRINEELCDGCGLCAQACAEGAIQVIDGKAHLVSESYCDGLGACIGECPQGAITIEEREAPEFDPQAVSYHLLRQGKTLPNHGISSKQGGDRPRHNGGDRPGAGVHGLACGCPGSAVQSFSTGHSARVNPELRQKTVTVEEKSALTHWPVQLKLVPPTAPYLQGADILVCADCVPFTVPDFHRRFLEGRVVLVGCPKLDDLDYYLEKLTEIFEVARPRSISVLRMEVPCCGGIAQAALQARQMAAPEVPFEVHILGIRGGEQVIRHPAGEPRENVAVR